MPTVSSRFLPPEVAMRSKSLRIGQGAVLALLLLAGPGIPAGARAADKPLSLAGHVLPAAQADLFCQAAGVVDKVLVDIGDQVKKGQVLLQVAAPELEHDLNKSKATVVQAEARVELARLSVEVAEANLEAAKAQVQEAEAVLKRAKAHLDLHQKEYERIRALQKENVVTGDLVLEVRSKLEAATASVAEAEARVRTIQVGVRETQVKRERAAATVKEAEAGVLVARAEVQRAQVLIEQTRVLAPFDGVVVRRSVNVGEFVGPPGPGHREPILTVVRIDTVRAVAEVSENDAARVALETPAVVQVPALPGRSFEGKVTRVSPWIDPKTGTFRIEIDLPNLKGELRPGMFARVDLRMSKAP
jgi:multidrug resistance efflux pump